MIEGLTNKVVIVTGGAHGIGKAYCSAFTKAGAHVVIADIDKDGAEIAANEISNAAMSRGDLRSAPHPLPLYVDVSNEAATKEMAARTIDRFGRIDVLINNAAVFSVVPMNRGRIESIDPQE